MPRKGEKGPKPIAGLRTNKVKPSSVDWEEVAYQYRTTTTAPYTIAQHHGITLAQIQGFIKREGLVRDLKARVRARTDEELDAIVRHEELDPARKRTDSDRISAQAKVRATVILSHRRDIKNQRRLLLRLTKELEAETSAINDFWPFLSKLRDSGQLTAEDAQDTVKAIKRFSGLANRADILKKLSDILKTLLGLEREAFDLNTPEEKAPEDEASVERTLAGLYQAISGRSRGLPASALPTPGPTGQADKS